MEEIKENNFLNYVEIRYSHIRNIVNCQLRSKSKTYNQKTKKDSEQVINLSLSFPEPC